MNFLILFPGAVCLVLGLGFFVPNCVDYLGIMVLGQGDAALSDADNEGGFGLSMMFLGLTLVSYAVWSREVPLWELESSKKKVARRDAFFLGIGLFLLLFGGRFTLIDSRVFTESALWPNALIGMGMLILGCILFVVGASSRPILFYIDEGERPPQRWQIALSEMVLGLGTIAVPITMWLSLDESIREEEASSILVLMVLVGVGLVLILASIISFLGTDVGLRMKAYLHPRE
jgi:uncharacterized membrane protein YidH (DUF202 family)